MVHPRMNTVVQTMGMLRLWRKRKETQGALPVLSTLPIPFMAITLLFFPHSEVLFPSRNDLHVLSTVCFGQQNQSTVISLYHSVLFRVKCTVLSLIFLFKNNHHPTVQLDEYLQQCLHHEKKIGFVLVHIPTWKQNWLLYVVALTKV